MYKYGCADLDIGNFPGILCADYLHAKPGSTAQSMDVNGRTFPLASAELQRLVLKPEQPKGDRTKLAAQLDQLMAKDRTVISSSQAKLLIEAPPAVKAAGRKASTWSNRDDSASSPGRSDRLWSVQ
ncbi:hypothetical protein [Phenylobacterium aquaticum]|uniref:hypothetical protein n=1 Tax=Phenylobacterium aquaticum TaxID=1763816 RepID=UPI001F5C90FB|nr:hypothetical protein [Phenylobacterium aquaticum]MCI3133141.1 hypothetical protein [Phenylobacterium aquaticum]